MRMPALKSGNPLTSDSRRSRAWVKYSASAIDSGQSVTSCAVRNSQAVCSCRPSGVRMFVSRGTVTPSAREPSARSGSSRTTAIEGVGAR